MLRFLFAGCILISACNVRADIIDTVTAPSPQPHTSAFATSSNKAE